MAEVVGRRMAEVVGRRMAEVVGRNIRALAGQQWPCTPRRPTGVSFPLGTGAGGRPARWRRGRSGDGSASAACRSVRQEIRETLAVLDQNLGEAVAGAFRLGAPVARLEPLSGGRSHRSWRMRTTEGDWAVKVLNRSREQWWMDDYLIAVRIEQAALAYGIAMPRPMHPAEPTAPLLADVTVGDAVYSARVHEWVNADGDPGPEVLPWVGETLAALHGLPVHVDAADVAVYEPQDTEKWHKWLSDVPAEVPSGFIEAVRAHLPDIAQAKQILDRERSEQLTSVFTHRDFKPDNVLGTAGGPVLVDWDEAGLDVAEWEVTRAALAFSREGDGWDRRRFDRVLRSYQTAGGRRIPAVRASFAGVLRHELGAATFLMYRALGHRPVTPAERLASYAHTLEFLTDLRRSLRCLPLWTRWLASGS